MKRREFLTLSGGVAASAMLWPLATRAHPARTATVGVLSSAARPTQAALLPRFLEGLRDAGFEEGRNLAIEYRWADGRYERLPAMATELVRRPVDVLVTFGGNVSALAAKRATSSKPIVFITNDDPVATGLVESLSRPGGNMTGVSGLGSELGAKNLELVDQVLPAVSVIGVLMNPLRPSAEIQLEIARNAAKAVGKTVRPLYASDKRDIDAVFDTVTRERIGAVIVSFDILFNNQHRQIIALAARYAVPTVYFRHEFVVAGGLMGYSTSAAEAFRLSGDYAGRILKGAKPSELPVQQATKVELSLNLKTAKALGLTIPLTLLGRADEVIE